MRTASKIFIIVIISTHISCKTNIIFDSFTPMNHYEMLENINKWDTGFMDKDSNIIFPLLKDTFQAHFDIDKNSQNALIFSIDKIDTVGFIKAQNKIVYFFTQNANEKYKLFDFTALLGDKYEIKNCGPLVNNTLRISDVEHRNNEIIQTICVEEGKTSNLNLPPPPSLHKLTAIKTFKVSSKYGITEMDIFVERTNQEIKIKNAP